MANVKYQIFISSTYTDLQREREQVIKAILEMGHIPVGMEMFSAADEEQWKIIARQIDLSDYYIVIIAHRYGSVVDGKSYTEKEYDYAMEKGVPVLGFIIEDSAVWTPGYIDKDASAKEPLDRFKQKVKKKPVGFWRSAEDLHSKASIALMKSINTQPRPGWIRTSDITTNPEVSAELTRLSRENAELRKQTAKLVQDEKTKDDEEIQDALKRLIAIKVRCSVRLKGESGWKQSFETTLSQVFNIIGPELISEAALPDIAYSIGIHLSNHGDKVEHPWPIPSNTLQGMLSDLFALGLVAPSQRKHSAKDLNEYWTLTKKGAELLRRVRLYSLEVRSKAISDKKTEKATAETEAKDK